jgi:hypothetical protein
MTCQLEERPMAAVTGGEGRGPRGRRATLSGAVGRCAVPGCEVRIDLSRLMCRQHWYQVPKTARDRVWAAWRSGQGVRDPQYWEAVGKAVASIHME